MQTIRKLKQRMSLRDVEHALLQFRVFIRKQCTIRKIHARMQIFDDPYIPV